MHASGLCVGKRCSPVVFGFSPEPLIRGRLLLQVPDQGRGLFAATDLEQGMLIHEEAPMLAAPSPHALDTTCHQCLRPLPLGAIAAAAAEGSAASTAASIPVCSPGCSTAAQDTWASAATADLRPLQQACRESGSKFPLMVAQLALRRIQRELQAGSAAPDARSTAQPKTLFGGEADVACGDPLTQLRHLCYANVSEPPQAWAELHALLLQGLLHSGGNQGSGGVTCSADWMERELSLRWFCDAMARLHINSFRFGLLPAALLAAGCPLPFCPAGTAAALPPAGRPLLLSAPANPLDQLCASFTLTLPFLLCHPPTGLTRWCRSIAPTPPPCCAPLPPLWPAPPARRTPPAARPTC